jgi:hypothetical protein
MHKPPQKPVQLNFYYGISSLRKWEVDQKPTDEWKYRSFRASALRAPRNPT